MVEVFTLRDADADANAVPASMSRRQFFQVLAITGVVSQDEALAAVRAGSIPSQLQHAIDTITDPAERFAALMLISGATTFERQHPMTIKFGEMLGNSPADLDYLWRYGNSL